MRKITLTSINALKKVKLENWSWLGWIFLIWTRSTYHASNVAFGAVVGHCGSDWRIALLGRPQPDHQLHRLGPSPCGGFIRWSTDWSGSNLQQHQHLADQRVHLCTHPGIGQRRANPVLQQVGKIQKKIKLYTYAMNYVKCWVKN